MDPLDREKPWGPVGQLVLLTLVIGLIYLIFRFAVVIPEWGWQLIAAATGVGVLLYYVLAFRWHRRRRDIVRPAGEERARRAALRVLLAVLLVVGLTLPIWVALYFLWLGGELWR